MVAIIAQVEDQTQDLLPRIHHTFIKIIKVHNGSGNQRRWHLVLIMSVVGNNRVGIPIVVLHDAEGAVIEVETNSVLRSSSKIEFILHEGADQVKQKREDLPEINGGCNAPLMRGTAT